MTKAVLQTKYPGRPTYQSHHQTNVELRRAIKLALRAIGWSAKEVRAFEHTETLALPKIERKRFWGNFQQCCNLFPTTKPLSEVSASHFPEHETVPVGAIIELLFAATDSISDR